MNERIFWGILGYLVILWMPFLLVYVLDLEMVGTWYGFPYMITWIVIILTSLLTKNPLNNWKGKK